MKNAVKQMTDAELLTAYRNGHERVDEIGILSHEGQLICRVLSDIVYQEIISRHLESKAMEWHLMRYICDASSEEIKRLHDILDDETQKDGEGIFDADDFTPDGEPISDLASIVEGLRMVLETELKDREGRKERG